MGNLKTRSCGNADTALLHDLIALNRNFWGLAHIFGGSFSAVWKDKIARRGAFCSVFRNVHVYTAEAERNFADLRTNFQNFVKEV